MVGYLIGQLVFKNHCDFEVIIGVESLRSFGLCVKLSLEVLTVEDGGSGRNIDGEAEDDYSQSAEYASYGGC